MKSKLRISIFCLFSLLFISALTLLPERTSANDPASVRSREAESKGERASSGRSTAGASRERYDRPTPVTPTTAEPKTKPGVLKRATNFVKGLFAPVRKEQVSRNQDDEEGND